MHTSHPMRSSLPVLLLTGALLAGCGSSSSSGSTSTAAPAKKTPAASAPATSGPQKVLIAGFKFKPANLTVSVGTKVTFTNKDSSNHTATADTSGLQTGNLQQGKSKTVTLTKKGTIAYHCDYHPFMKGTIVVK